MDAIRIENIRPEYFAGMEQLQRDCYPTLGEVELMRVPHFESQHAVFAEGQFVALDGDRVIGMGSGFFIDFDFEHPNHSFSEICDGFYFTRHDPDGAYYYGADLSVHPDYRGRGIARLLYDARTGLVRRCNRRGIVAGGLIPGYAAHRGAMSVHEYVEHVVRGELRDPTLSMQLHMGFRVRGMIPNYIEDSASDNWATLIEWVNPDYVEPLPSPPAARSHTLGNTI